MILCGGDALIDFVPVAAPDGGEAFQPRIGGAVLNCATALTRFGEDVSYVGALSQDLFGDMLFDHMKREGIATELVTRTTDDSTLAFVTLDGGEAKYAFYDNTSAGRLWSGVDKLSQQAKALHIGSVTLIADPSAAAYADLAMRLSGDMVISLDPNCRPSLIPDADSYRARIKGIASHSHLIRFSDEDFAYLYPDQKEEAVAHELVSKGTHLVLISRGPGGASAYWAGGRIDVPARLVNLVDSIGAGDTFHAGVLAALSQSKHLSIEGLQQLDRSHLGDVMNFATAAAAMNCETAGCNPPSRVDVLLSART